MNSKTSLSLPAFVIMLILALPLCAQTNDKRWALSLFAGTAVLDGDGDVISLNGSGGGAIKYSLAENFALRLQGSFGRMSVNKIDHISTNTFYDGNVSALLNLVNFKKKGTGKNVAQLYFGIGVGAVIGDLAYKYPKASSIPVEQKTTGSLMIPMGPGLRFYIDPLVDLGLEYSIRATFTDNLDGGPPPLSVDHRNDYYSLIQGFITFNLGKRKERCLEWIEPNERLGNAIAEAKEAMEKEKKAASEQVEKLRIQFEKQLAENEHKSDSLIAAMKEAFRNDGDNDGVSDMFDKEPNTPRGATVDGAGRMLDSDIDGVPDHLDKCPTVPGKMFNNGCPVQPTKLQLDVISDVIRTLQFETGKSIIAPSSFPALLTLAVMLQENPNFNFRIEGHTDNVGDPQSNLTLSRERANAVKEYLVAHLVEPSRITAIGYGDTKPLVSNETAAGKARNRRVEMTVE